jgi:hypothetical protein
MGACVGPEQRQASLAVLSPTWQLTVNDICASKIVCWGDSHEYAKHIIQPHRRFQSA